MGFLRLIHHIHFDHDTGKFKSLAFKNSGDGSGISLVEKECAINASPTICGHIHRYYPNVVGEPAIFWHVPEGITSTCKLEQKTSSTGDICHHNMKGLSDPDARRAIKDVPLNEMMVCENGTYRPLTLSDIPK